MDREEHPQPSDLARLIAGQTATGEARALVEHLLTGCSHCALEMSRLAELAPRPALSAGEGVSSYDQALSKASRAVRERASDMARELEESRQFVHLLEAQPPLRQALLLRNSRRGRSRPVVELLLERSFSLRFDDPARMVELAELALRVAGDLDREKYGTETVVDLEVRAGAELANALRVAGQLEAAIRTLFDTLRLARRGSGDPLLKARVYEVAALIFRRRRRQNLAAKLLERAYRLFLRMGECQQAGRVLVSWGVLESQRPDPRACLERLSQASELLDLSGDSQLALSVVHNMLFALVDLERFEAADEMLAECRHLYLEHSDRLTALRLKWLEARICGGSRRDLEAEVKLLEVTHGFEQVGCPHESSLARLDLALLLARQNRLFELKVLVEEMVLSFKSENIEREAIAALLVLAEALERPRAPIFLIGKVRRFLLRLPHERGLRFEA